MKQSAIALMLCLLASPSIAQIDTDSDQICIYFDTNATVYEITSVPYVIQFAYLVITRPTAPPAPACGSSFRS